MHTGQKPTHCGACSRKLWSPDTDLICHFATKGFHLSNQRAAIPCRSAYHQKCLRVGMPFTCRRRNKEGLHFPFVKHWPLFICECCTVRAVVKRELGSRGDRHLLQLERMRMLDVANSWAAKTHASYRSKLTYLKRFETTHPGVLLLAVTVLTRPPTPESVALAWAEVQYSVQPSPLPGRSTVAFGTMRQLRSAAGWHHTMAWLVGQPGTITYEDKGNRLIKADTLLTQDAALARFTKGIQNRLGDKVEPSWALLDRHVRAFDEFFEANYTQSTTAEQKRRWARAGLGNLLLWLGWLRSGELFDLRWMDIERIAPADGPRIDLPPGVGCLLLRLNEQTKSSPSATADLPLAYTTLSGYHLGRWYERLARHRPTQVPVAEDPTYIFVHETGARWDSYFYRHEFIYPLLYKLQVEGDPHLAPLHGPGVENTIPGKFPSLHMYRRGGRTHVDLIREVNSVRRKASPAEIYEHGRWRRSRSGEQIDIVYRAWTPMISSRSRYTVYDEFTTRVAY